MPALPGGAAMKRYLDSTGVVHVVYRATGGYLLRACEVYVPTPNTRQVPTCLCCVVQVHRAKAR